MNNYGVCQSHGIRLKLALISDVFTHLSLLPECCVRAVTPLNYRFILKYWKPDLLLVESAWQGKKDCWKYKIASYPDYPKRSNKKLRSVIEYAKNLHIPCVFWNKEDSVHFDRFIDSARLADHIFTVDANAIMKYKDVLGKDASVHTLPFAIQPQIHYFKGHDFKHNRANFVGSYSAVHPIRKQWQDMAFHAASDSRLGLTIIDRNSNRKAKHYRFPSLPDVEILPSVPYNQTAQIYRDYLISINVNTIENSPTMFSRRLIEILACGGIAVTNKTRAVDELFANFCLAASTQDELFELFNRFCKGPSKKDLEMAKTAAYYVSINFTWKQNLEKIVEIANI